MTPDQAELAAEIERQRSSKIEERKQKAEEAAKQAAADEAAAKKGGKKPASKGGPKSPKDQSALIAGMGTPSVDAGVHDSLDALVAPGINIKSTDDDPSRQKDFIEFKKIMIDMDMGSNIGSLLGAMVYQISH